MTVTAAGVTARKSSTSSTRAAARGPARAGAVEHLSRADRVAGGKDARAVAPLESHAEFTSGPGAGSGRVAAGPGGVAGAGAGAGAARADAGVAVHVLPGRGAADGGYLGGSAKFDQAIADFAETYADQNELDYAALKAAVKDGRAEATTEI